MKPIRDRADVAFSEALRCVEFRVPQHPHFRKRTLNLALSLRYGLMASAALIYLHDMADYEDRFEPRSHLDEWPDRVALHYSTRILEKLPQGQPLDAAGLVGRNSLVPIQISLSLRKQQGLGISQCLQKAAEIFYRECRFSIFSEYWWVMKHRATQVFEGTMAQSVAYAMNFYERRHYDLDEVPEIALIGE